MTREQIEQIQDNIEELISMRVDCNSGFELRGKLEKISRFLADSSKCVREAKKMYLTMHNEWLRQHKAELNAMKPSVAKTFSDTALVNEQILLLRAEGNAKDLKYAGEFLRSVLSNLKSEMSLQ